MPFVQVLRCVEARISGSNVTRFDTIGACLDRSFLG